MTTLEARGEGGGGIRGVIEPRLPEPLSKAGLEPTAASWASSISRKISSLISFQTAARYRRGRGVSAPVRIYRLFTAVNEQIALIEVLRQFCPEMRRQRAAQADKRPR